MNKLQSRVLVIILLTILTQCTVLLSEMVGTANVIRDEKILASFGYNIKDSRQEIKIAGNVFNSEMNRNNTAVRIAYYKKPRIELYLQSGVGNSGFVINSTTLTYNYASEGVKVNAFAGSIGVKYGLMPDTIASPALAVDIKVFAEWFSTDKLKVENQTFDIKALYHSTGIETALVVSKKVNRYIEPRIGIVVSAITGKFETVNKTADTTMSMLSGFIGLDAIIAKRMSVITEIEFGTETSVNIGIRAGF